MTRLSNHGTVLTKTRRSGTVRWAIGLVFLAAGLLPAATNYYVATNGADGNSGTSLSAPFKTIQKAASVMTAGDNCYVRQGTYRETVTPVNSGSSGLPITFQSYQNEVVTVSGADTVTGWTVHSGNIYKASVNFTCAEVFVDGKRMGPAQFPNVANPSDLLTNLKRTPNLNVNDVAITFYAPGLPPGINYTGATVWTMAGDYWVSNTSRVTSYSGNVLYINNKSSWWYKDDGYGYVTGLLALLDTTREWFHGGGQLYLWAPDNGSPEGHLVEAGRRRLAFDFSNKSYISLIGINVFSATISMDAAHYCVVDSCKAEYICPFFTISEGWNRFHGNRKADVDTKSPSRTAIYNEGNGIIMSGNNNILKNSTIGYSYGDGITVYGTDNVVENCLVHDCNWSGTDCALISAAGHRTIIRRNTVYKGGRAGILHRMLTAGRIEYNDIHDTQMMTDDGGGTYAYYQDGENTVIAYNWVHDDHGWSRFRAVGAGIYLDNNCANYIVHHNVVWNCSNGMRINSAWTNYQIYNNTLMKGMVDGFSGQSKYNVKTNNNLSDTGPFEGIERLNNLATPNPGFVNAAAGDFRLTSTSPAINYGMVIPGITDGYIGDKPDAGAYEYGGTAWKAGCGYTVEAAAPVISPSGGLFADAVLVTITCAVTDAQIRYTTNGSDPTSSSTLYAGPFLLTGTTTIKAQGFKSGASATGVASAVFTKSTVVAQPSITPAGGNFTDSVMVSISCSTPGADIRYTTNGTDPIATSSQYTIPFKLTATTTVKARGFKTGLTESAVVTALFASVVPAVATPVITPAGGSFNDSAMVTISCGTAGATIRYTTNGTDPTTSSPLYSAPIKLTTTTTVKARAFKTGLTESAVATAMFAKYLVGGNLALGRPVTISSTDGTGPGSNSVDGNDATRWSLAYSDNQWISIDLQGTYIIASVVLKWDPAYATAYRIEVSNNGTDWTTAYTTTSGTGGVETIVMSGTPSGRYIRMYGTARKLTYGFSLWEFEVYGGSVGISPQPGPMQNIQTMDHGYGTVRLYNLQGRLMDANGNIPSGVYLIERNGKPLEKVILTK